MSIGCYSSLGIEQSATSSDYRLCVANQPLDHIALQEMVLSKPNLTELDLANTNVASLDFLRHCPQLTKLRLASCQFLQNVAFVALAELPKLQYLDCQGCRGFDDKATLSVSELKELTFCDLSDCTELTGAGLKRLPQSIEHLFLKGLPKLKKDTPGILCRFSRLISLDLSQSTFSGTTLPQLAALVKLESLGLWQCLRVEDGDLLWLKGRSMRRVDLSFCTQLTDVVLGCLGRCTDLTLDGCQYLSDVGVRPLINGHQVKTISLTNCPRISLSMEQELRTRFKDREAQYRSRPQADSDVSMGLMRDLCPETMKKLAAMLESADWRSLANGLGYTYESLRHLQSIEQVLSHWIAQNRVATVKRLSFEADLCGLEQVSRYLATIPLELDLGKRPTRSLPEIVKRYVTYFDLCYIDALVREEGYASVNWNSAQKLLKGIDFAQVDPKIDVRFIIGQSGQLKLETLCLIMCTDTLGRVRDKMLKELETGNWEPVSPGGITYWQVEQLAKAIQDAEADGLLLDKAKMKKAFALEWQAEEERPTHEMVHLFWQKECNVKLSLADFVDSVRHLLLETGDESAKKVSQAIFLRYRQIRPYRPHPP